MNINGKAIAEDIKNDLKEVATKLPKRPRLDIIYAGSDPVIEGFLKMKLRASEYISVETQVHRFPASVSQETLISEVRGIADDPNSDGTIIQLPLPATLDTEAVLRSIPPEKDVDVLSSNALALFESGGISILPPVVGAIAEITKRWRISVTGKNAVVLGNGRLVGKPASIWLTQNGAQVTVLDKTSGDPAQLLQKADIIVSGVGVPGLIQSDMIRERVMLFDAGASEEAGEIKGDADSACAAKCAIFTPVPGGIGPITVVMLFKNLLEITEAKWKKQRSLYTHK
ncbi:MAG: bifunctional 5,10-methylenetetrahydrofolate dehydrogenase/5,10-methenyltetrahydrofolate cyclohydrolase [Parcubacteria group bacterium]|nr:bifunctional 5,10-methylenetetrahydrofolate dehydrogenase/5,10-methenyltetrahydrofolate cyclohydrolase [Parcubacteria group bacterium]